MRPALRSADELPELESDSRGRVLDVSLAGARGERWRTVGIGGSVDEALEWARSSAPAGTAWLVSGWSDLYGD
jgi:hypothetical protein